MEGLKFKLKTICKLNKYERETIMYDLSFGEDGIIYNIVKYKKPRHYICLAYMGKELIAWVSYGKVRKNSRRCSLMAFTKEKYRLRGIAAQLSSFLIQKLFLPHIHVYDWSVEPVINKSLRQIKIDIVIHP